MASVHAFVDQLHRLVSFLVGALLALMLVVVVGLVLARYVFAIPIFGGDEFARYAMFYMVMLGAAVAIRNDQHPRLMLVLDLFPEAARQKILFVIDLLLVVVLGIMFWQGWDMAVEEAITSTPSLRLSFFWIYLAIPIGAGAGLVQLLAGRPSGRDTVAQGDEPSEVV